MEDGEEGKKKMMMKEGGLYDRTVRNHGGRRREEDEGRWLTDCGRPEGGPSVHHTPASLHHRFPDAVADQQQVRLALPHLHVLEILILIQYTLHFNQIDDSRIQGAYH
ncbi:unnamed protein product, partial [Musa acuminata subsp. burmannicoides]